MATSPTSTPHPVTLRERLIGVVGMVTTPLVPADYLDRVDPLRSGQALRGRIVAVHPETRDAVTVVIRPGRDWAGHLAGQYVRLGIDVDGVRQWRTYSLTSPSDRADGCLTITVKAVAGGVVSNHLVRRARVGTVVHLDQAAGDFVLPERRPDKVLFVTAGSGITPVMAMLRDSVDELHDVLVVHSAPTSAEMVFAGELRMLATARRIRLIERHTTTEGRLDVATVARLVPDLAERETWACGPASLLDDVEAHWAAHGIADRLHVERFRPAVLAGSAGDGGGSVTFSRSGTVVETDGTTPLLEAGEDAGVLMPSGCRMGICFGCVVPLRAGVVRDLRNGEITTATPGDGVLIQTCVTAAAGACDIDL